MKNGYYDVTPVYENTTMQARYVDDVIGHYRIYPASGYVLHDNEYDYHNEEDGFHTIGFTRGSATMGANYDFVANPREFYAIPENELPEFGEIFGGGNNDHEVV